MAKISINIVSGTLQKEEFIVGIDLGTTNSLIAIMDEVTKKPKILKEFDNTSLVPSIVHFDSLNNIVVGDTAKQMLEIFPERTIASVKRLIGKSYNDISEENKYFSYNIIDDDTEKLVKIQIGNTYYSPIELSSFILKELKKRAEHILKTTVNKCVITVPAYFNDAQRQATRDAGKLAGLNVLRIINEPTAASLAYGVGSNDLDSKTVAVYDLGGGTFDISILKIENGIFEVLSTNGDTHLGGDDIDNLLLDFFANQLNISLSELKINKESFQKLKTVAESAKIKLSNIDIVESNFENSILKITKSDFEKLLQPIVQKTILCCKNAVRDAQLHISDIDTLIFVGGSTKIPYIKSAVSTFFNTVVKDNINPHEVVALGAALQADVLAGNTSDILLLDITPLSLGVETMGGLMDVLIPRNNKIPYSVSRQYTTQKDGQSGMKIAVYQGERDLVTDNRKLAEFELKGIPAMPAGLPKVEIRFNINADGILKVIAKELRSGVEQAVEVKPQYGLTDEEVEQMLKDSIQYAQTDVQTRALVEAKTEADQMISLTENFMEKNKNYLSSEEINNTQVAINKLNEILKTENKDDIQSAIQELNIVTQPFAERVMDKAVEQALKGSKI